jgi:hypothetical protein
MFLFQIGGSLEGGMCPFQTAGSSSVTGIGFQWFALVSSSRVVLPAVSQGIGIFRYKKVSSGIVKPRPNQGNELLNRDKHWDTVTTHKHGSQYLEGGGDA